MFNPATTCCPHPKNKHHRVGFKPCTTAGCECKGYWRQPELAAAAK
jgi:hypothetical protein